MSIRNEVITKTEELIALLNKKNASEVVKPRLTIEVNRKFIRVIYLSDGDIHGSRSANAFVDTETGMIYPSASWKAADTKRPPRGNVNNPDGGLGAFSNKGLIGWRLN